jgi:outer membrane receptor protein involved in Fe transport
MSWQLSLLVIAPSIIPDLAMAQAGSTGAISGIVTDSQSAIVAGAEVQAQQLATGVVTRTTTNGAGVYTFPYLPIGNYEVRIKAPGMKEAVITGVIVDQRNISRVDRALEIGSASESVTVADQAPLLQQESTTYDATVNRQFVEDLPNIVAGGSRDATNLTLLVPGVVASTAYGTQFGVNVGGGRQFSTEYQIDGMNLAYQGVGPGVPLSARPDQDIVSEVKVQIGIPSAEYGRTSGGVVEFLTRSGTNELHANATTLIRNTKLNARAYNAASVGVDQEWELALSAGGPIYIPKVYNGKNKTFWFFNYTRYRVKPGGGPSSTTVPTAKERGGDFSELSTPIYDPTNHQPFAGNIIPPNRLSSISQALVKLYPLPTNSAFVNNFNGLTPSSNVNDDYFGKFDHYITDNNRITGSARTRHTGGIYSQGPFGLALDSNTNFQDTQQAIIADDWTLSPRLVNHFSASELGFHVNQNQGRDVGIEIPNHFGPGMPAFYFQDGGYRGLSIGLGTAAGAQNSFEQDRSRDIQDAVSWIVGSHSFKFGTRYNWFQAAGGGYDVQNGYYSFTGLTTGLLGVSGTGNSFASFLLGAPVTASLTKNANTSFHTQGLGLYAQDGWKVSKKLTLTYGLRWDFQTFPYEQNGQVAAIDLKKPNPGAGGLPGAYVFGKGDTNQNSLFSYIWHGAFAPRVGVAYSLNPTTVVRVSGGILYSPPGNNGLTNSTGYSGSATLNSPDGGSTPAFYWDAGWPAGSVKQPPILDPTYGIGQSVSFVSSSANQWANTNSWQFDIQKSVARDFVFNVGYLGQSSHHLPNEGIDLTNQLNPKYLTLGTLLNKSITDPAVAAAGYRPPYAGFTGTLAQALKPYPQFFAVGPEGAAIGNSSYNALFVKAEKRFASGFQYLVSYTFSKTLTDTGLSAYGRFGPQDTFNRGVEKSLSQYDVPQNLVVSFTYQLPWGPGRPFLSKGVLGNIAGGWALAGIMTYQGGMPLVIGAPNNLPLGNGHLDAVYLGGPINTSTSSRSDVSLSNGLTGQQGTVTLNKNAFGFPAPFTFGNTYLLPNIRTLGSASENFSLFKRQTFHEKYMFELRFDVFNAFNRKNFAGLITDLTNPAFGQYTGAGSNPRAGQIGAKIVF